MGPITKMYNEAMECAEKRGSTNKVRCLRLKLEQDIGDDKDKLLYYKIECSKLADYTPSSFAISVITLIVTLLSIVVTDGNSLALAATVLVYLVVSGILAILTLKHTGRYKTVLMVLERIERDKKW